MPLTIAFPTSRRAGRRLASVMLALWLLALGIGVANACLLHPQTNRQGVTGPAVTGKLASQSGHAQGASHEPGELACAEFCALEQATLVKQQKHPLPDALGALGSAPLLAQALAAPEGRPGYWIGSRDERPRAPIFIRFLRLTL